MTAEPPFAVVIAGGGVAALEAALALREIAGDRVSLTLVAPRADFRFRPLAVGLPFAAGHPGRLELAAFAAEIGAVFIRASVRSVEPEPREVLLDSGERLTYDALLVAVGARPRPWLPGALHFTDEAEPEGFAGLLRDLEEGYVRRVAFVVPPRSGWPLPLYELALMTARQARSMGIEDAELTLVTPEAAPLSLFGPRASRAVSDELRATGITLVPGVWAEPDPEQRGMLLLHPGDRRLAIQRSVTLPALEAIRIDGVPAGRNGFVPVDPFVRAHGAERIWAAGDGTDFPVKQGGLAAQQADVAATGIAAAAGLPVTGETLSPVLHGTLLTGDKPWHLRWAPGDGDGLAVQRPLWWPPTKIAGRRLSPYLAAHLEAPAGLHVAVPVARAAEGRRA